MDLIEQRRDPLHLIKHYRTIAREIPELESKQARVSEELLVAPFVKEVDEVRIWELLAGPGGLSRASDAEEEEAPGRGRQNATVACGCHLVATLPCNMAAWYAPTPADAAGARRPSR